MTQRIRLIALASVAAVAVLATGVFVTVRLVANRIDNAIPQADLFGTPTPTPAPTTATPDADPEPHAAARP